MSAIQVKCIQKFKDKTGKIIGYRLIDLNGVTQDVKAENLKAAISAGKVNVVNLTLTSDGRLVGTKEKGLQNKSLGTPPSGIDAKEVGKQAGNYGYFRYLDPKYFGVTSNSYFTVGHKVTGSDRKEHPEYKGYDYVLHKDFNLIDTPRVALCGLFKDRDSDTVEVRVLLGRYGYVTKSSVSIVGYIKDYGYFTLQKKDNPEVWAKTLAQAFNTTAIEVFKLAEQNPELNSYLQLGEALKKY